MTRAGLLERYAASPECPFQIERQYRELADQRVAAPDQDMVSPGTSRNRQHLPHERT